MAFIGAVAGASAAGAQQFAPLPEVDRPYSLKVDVLAKDGAVLEHKSVKCKSFLDACDDVVPFTVEGKVLKVWVHGRTEDDGRNFFMQVAPSLKDPPGEFERTGFSNRMPKTGQEWEGELLRKHDFDYDPKWTAAEREAAHKQPPTLLAKIRIRIEE